MYGRKYKYKGLIYIVDRRRRKEITCYAESLQLKKVKLSNDMELQLRVAKNNLGSKSCLLEIKHSVGC